MELAKQMRKWRPHTSDHVVVGKVARVTDRIPPGRLGTVLVPVRGGTEEFFARTAGQAALAPGLMVRVVAHAPPRTVDVEPLDGPTLSQHPTPEL